MSRFVLCVSVDGLYDMYMMCFGSGFLLFCVILVSVFDIVSVFLCGGLIRNLLNVLSVWRLLLVILNRFWYVNVVWLLILFLCVFVSVCVVSVLLFLMLIILCDSCVSGSVKLLIL